jgi:DNA-binding IclR family transcriptional regulator|tara:strand:- start:365 stop:1135 length:771 start_codon:yes stop_codon:yes gene_type:complete
MVQDLKYINKSLEKSFKILEILSKSIFPLKASNISRKANLSRTTTFRLLSVLSVLGYIHKNLSSNTYTMGHKAFQFGETSDYLQSISETSKEILKNISSQTNLITYLAMLEGSQIVHSDKISNNTDDATVRTFRMRLDAHCCSLGKVMLAYRPENEVSTIYRSYNFYPHTNNTITNLIDLKKQLTKIRKDGFALNHGEAFENSYGIGVAILDKDKRSFAGIALSGSKNILNPKSMDDFVHLLQDASIKISKLIVDN